MRVIGWLLLGMGAVLSAITFLAMVGVFPLQIDFFGLDLDTRTDRMTFAVGSLLVAAIGLGLLIYGRRQQGVPPGS